MKINAIVISIVLMFASLQSVASTSYVVNHCDHAFIADMSSSNDMAFSDCQSAGTECQMTLTNCQPHSLFVVYQSSDVLFFIAHSLAKTAYVFHITDHTTLPAFIPPIA